MATGIEAAGLALGLFPLVIEGIKFYVSFAQKFKEMKDHKHTLDKFRRDLRMEKSKFHNTWCTLMNRAGVYIEPSVKPLPKTTERILSCLPAHAVGSFVDGCQELNTILGELRNKFQKYEQTDYPKMFIMFRHFTMEDREQCIERIYRLNSDLDKLVNGAPQTATVEANKLQKLNVAEHYQRVRTHAIILYGSLKERLQISSCHCTTPHRANLQLDVCILGTFNSYSNHPKMGRLSLLFPIPAEQVETGEYLTLQELEFEHLQNPDPEESTSDKKIPECHMKVPGPELPSPLLHTIDQQLDTVYTATKQKTGPAKHSRFKSKLKNTQAKVCKQTKKKVEFCLSDTEIRSPNFKSLLVANTFERKIECLCSTIRNIKEMRTCVGTLVSNNNKHRVWVPKAPLTSATVLSLAELLSRPEPPRRERLKLAVRLASSVLQLHRTEWLQERWGKQDIYLIQTGSSRPKRPSLETPVVHQAFTPESSVSGALIESRFTRRNLSLFSLGIVLIELWFWKSVESFQDDEPQACCGPEGLDAARYEIAQGLIEALYEDAGDSYGDSVRRCIIGIDHKEIRLENDGFRGEVYLKVLQPLERHLEFFCDEPLEEIFQKQGS